MQLDADEQRLVLLLVETCDLPQPELDMAWQLHERIQCQAHPIDPAVLLRLC